MAACACGALPADARTAACGPQLARQGAAVPEALQADFLHVLGLAPTLLDELLKLMLRPRPPFGKPAAGPQTGKQRRRLSPRYPARLQLAAARVVGAGVQPVPDAGAARGVRPTLTLVTGWTSLLRAAAAQVAPREDGAVRWIAVADAAAAHRRQRRQEAEPQQDPVCVLGLPLFPTGLGSSRVCPPLRGAGACKTCCSWRMPRATRR